jgi:antitoxin component of MazEF toxin-antitoxin module
VAVLVKVRKWGSGLAVVIPKQFAKERKIGVGSIIDLESCKPLRRRYKLSELVAGFKRRHRHGEWNLGDRVGREIW